MALLALITTGAALLSGRMAIEGPERLLFFVALASTSTVFTGKA